MLKKLLRGMFSRRSIVILLLLLQIVFMVSFLVSESTYAKLSNTILTLSAVFIALHIVSRDYGKEYKQTWLFLVLCFPVFGAAFYIIFRLQNSGKRVNKDIRNIEDHTKQFYNVTEDASAEAERDIPVHMPLVRYLRDGLGYPICVNSRAEYLTPGEVMLPRLLSELEKAEKYIFLEYFIIESGEMWDSVLDVLERKAEAGVDVRLIYDDLGCFFKLPDDYARKLRHLGIKCAVFNPFVPIFTALQNNRDHRKIAVIDGKVAFTGGINLADEYINKRERFGVWKDSAVVIEGEAAWSFTLIFLQMWTLCTKKKENYLELYPWKDTQPPRFREGYIQPFADSPLDNENVGKNVYLQMINNAKDYVYINTPYLIIDETMLSALKLAAKSGVDIRIVTPHIGDKKVVHKTTRLFYQELLNAGVRIYEYEEGFMHSKTFVSDDIAAVVGTINMDYRSFYLHFECGTCLYKCNAVHEVKKDFLETLETCTEVEADNRKKGFISRLFDDILILLAPIM